VAVETKKLLVGILVDSFVVSHWEYYMIQQILQGDYAEIAIIVQAETLTETPNEQNNGLNHQINSQIYRLIRKIDRRINTVSPNAFEPKNLMVLLPKTPVIHIALHPQANYDFIDETDSDKVQEYNLDVLVSLNRKKLRGKILLIPQYGVWAYYHGDYRVNSSGLFGLREVLEGREETGASLLLLSNDKRCEKLLFSSFSQTDSFSLHRNNNNNYWKSAAFAPRTLRELHRFGRDDFWQKVKQMNQHPIIFSQKTFELPGKSSWLVFLIKRLIKIVSQRWQRFFYYEQYILLFKLDKAKLLSNSLQSFEKLIPPYDRFWADPFIVHHDGKYYVFIEEVLGSRNKGHIAYFAVDEDGIISKPKMVIEQPYHMSYPFIFAYRDDYYMIPETAENKTIDIYRCTEFPDKWEYCSTIMQNVYAYDTTLLYKDEKWWLFVCMRGSAGMSSSDELFLFFADDLFAGPWIPHRQNPIVSDVRSARPAGNIFEYNGSLYRPSQNSAKRYGYGMKINHIVVLSEEEYREECVERVEPLWHQNVLSVHTLNFVDNLTIIDAELLKPRYPAAIFRKINSLFGFNT
jgi:hypothetical protein